MTSGILESLFGSSARTKLLRLFLLNQGMFFDFKEITRRAKISLVVAKKELNLLQKIDFVKNVSQKVENVVSLKNGKVKNNKKTVKGFVLNQFFPYINPLKTIFVDVTPISKEKLAKKLSTTGKIKLIILSGIFIQDDNSRIDLLLVGDSIKKGAIDRILKDLESTMGKELVYAIFTTQDFLYRLGMYDRFVRDVLDYPHEKIINKLNIE